MILGLSELQIAVAVAAALGAAFVRGLAGFGMAILLVPVLGLAIPPGEAVVVSNWLGVLIGLVGLRKILGNSEKSAYVIGGLAVLFTPLGVWLLAITDPAVARLVIALIALGSFVLVLLPKRAEHHAPSSLETGTTGITSGVLTGFEQLNNTLVRPFNPNPDAYKPTNVTGAPASSYELALTDPDFKFPQIWRTNVALDRRLHRFRPYGARLPGCHPPSPTIRYV